VKITNNGSGWAGASVTRVTWPLDIVATDVATPGIGHSATVTLYVDIPPACFGANGAGTCTFSVEADVTNAVFESREGNNIVSVECLGG
jgi:hypothetical protein